MILSAHQPNFIPHLPLLDKINKSDVFVLLVNVQFEKNGYQNRARLFDQWWTKPVKSGKDLICHKKYTDGQSLPLINEAWINTLCLTLGIDTGKIRYDFPTETRGTERIIELCKHYDCNQYLTNSDAMTKYLDEKAMNAAGIEVLPHTFPFRVHTFEAFNEWGIEGTQKLLRKEKTVWRNMCAT